MIEGSVSYSKYYHKDSLVNLHMRNGDTELHCDNGQFAESVGNRFNPQTMQTASATAAPVALSRWFSIVVHVLLPRVQWSFVFVLITSAFCCYTNTILVIATVWSVLSSTRSLMCISCYCTQNFSVSKLDTLPFIIYSWKCDVTYVLYMHMLTNYYLSVSSLLSFFPCSLSVNFAGSVLTVVKWMSFKSSILLC